MKNIMLTSFILILAASSAKAATFGCELGEGLVFQIRDLDLLDTPDEMTGYLVDEKKHLSFYRPELEGELLVSDLLLTFNGAYRGWTTEPVSESQVYVHLSKLAVDRMLNGFSFNASFEFISLPEYEDFSVEASCGTI